jgi:hypothetical protein
VAFLVSGLLAGAASADVSDFAFFDGTNPNNGPDPGAICGAHGAFTYHLTVQNWGPAGEVRITYPDGDFIRFQLATGQSFAMSQAGGNKSGHSTAVRVSNGESTAQLSGSLSAIGEGNPRCASCDVDGGIGDAGCDAFIPTP